MARDWHLTLELCRHNLDFEMGLRVRVPRRITRVTRVFEALVLSPPRKEKGMAEWHEFD